ncbi:MAG: sulfur carrier protein ThiS [Gammaproteobacteria bacterium]|nr:sulfur carrier protein ThiS [Gammaproteobacteria bacterium]
MNGRGRELPDNLTITGVLEELGYDERSVSVERNGQPVSASLFAELTVNDGDRVEIVKGSGDS